MSIYTDDVIEVSKIAVHIANNDTSYIKEAIEYINNNDCESSYIKIGDVLFPYWVAQYDTAPDEKTRNQVIDNMKSCFTSIFADKYIPIECWICMLQIRTLNDDYRGHMNILKQIYDMLNIEEHPITSLYIYRKIANYIVNGGLFYVEPYQTILTNIISAIDSVDIDPSEQPNYLS